MFDPFDGANEETLDALMDEMFKKHALEKNMDKADNESNARFWSDGGHIGSGNFEELKAQCFCCQKNLVPLHSYEVSTGGYEVTLECRDCNKKEKIKLSQTQINDINKQGTWQAFLK